MLINNSVLYEDNHYLIINNTKNGIFYYLDYDKRDSSINMEFQHLHPYFEIMICLSQNAIHLIEGAPYNIHFGDMVLLAPSVMHKTIYYKGEPSKRIIIDFMYPMDNPASKEAYDEILKPFFSECPIYRYSYEQSQILFDILNELFVFSNEHDYYDVPCHEFFIHHKFQEFLYKLYELSPNNLYKNEQTYNAIEQKVYEVASYIHTHYQSDLSLESLSEMFYVSPSYLSREFKQITHFNLITYIQTTRIKNAQYKLTSTNDKISEIATECGFTSFSQFNRIFNKLTGTSPRQYRQTSSSTVKK